MDDDITSYTYIFKLSFTISHLVLKRKEKKDQTSCKAPMGFISGGPLYTSNTQFLYISCSHLALPRNAS